LLRILPDLGPGEVWGIVGVGVKPFLRETSGDDNPIILTRPPVAKAPDWNGSDSEGRKPGEQRGLDTPVVLAVNDAR